jgi:amidase
MWISRHTAIPIIAALAFAAASGASSTAAEPTASSPQGGVSIRGIDLERSTIPDLQQAMDRGQLSSFELTLFYLSRIRDVDPELRSVITTSPTALGEALLSDLRRHTHRLRGPMDGIPVLLKDNIDTQIMPTTAGSEALLLARPDRDAFLVRQLRDGGAVILGKTNLSEWANFRSFSSSSGWSAVGGLTANPYVLDRNPCGSSSGSGAAISANLAVVAIGTETDGSIVCPSGASGIVGIKPTLGLVSRSGVVPISAQQDTAGPMTRNVTDAAVLLSVLAGVDPGDPATGDAAGHIAGDYTRFLDRNALLGKRIGVWREVTGGTNPETDALFDQFIGTLRRLGAVPIEVSLPFQDDINANEFPALLNEFKHDINGYLARTPGPHPADLAGLIEFNRQHASTELQFFDQNIFELSQALSGSLDDPGYKLQRKTATIAARRSIDETMATLELDAIAAPTNSPAWVTTLGQGDAFSFGSSSPAAVAGYPNITVPMGFVGELPVGVSFFSGRFDEPRLIALTFAFEQATRARRAPKFLPTVPAPSPPAAQRSSITSGFAEPGPGEFQGAAFSAFR